MWSIVTMDNGMLVTSAAVEPAAGYPNLCSSPGRDHRHRGRRHPRRYPSRCWLNTVARRHRFPMSTMPGEQVDHVFAGQMGPETIHFLEACILDKPAMVTPESARMVMETYTAADLPPSARTDRSAAVERIVVAGRRHGGIAARDGRPGHRPCHHRRRRVGLFPGEVARAIRRQVDRIAEKNHNRASMSREKIGADFVTQDYHELLKRPEVTCGHHRHRRASARRPDLGTVERGVPC